MGVTRVIDKSDKFRINDFLIDFHEKRRSGEPVYVKRHTTKHIISITARVY
jgi:hypothetical protein